MDKGIKLFKVFGIQISLNYSWFIIFGLIAWSLAQGYFPQMRPDLPLMTYWLMGLITALLLFLSVLLHELSHSYVALASGIEIKGITLFIFGGLARISREPSDARTEFKIAIAGPAASLALALVFWLSSRGVDFLMPGSVISSIFYYLFLINGILVAFNLIPGFPLDGGRLLRAYLWNRTDNLKEATRIASRVGKWFALLLIFAGFANIITGRLLNGIWFVFIGMFLRQAAAESYQVVVLQHSLEGVKVRDLMTSNVIAVDEGLSVAELVEGYFFKYRYTSFPVVSGEELRGIITLKVVKKLPREEWAYKQVRDIMSGVFSDAVLHPDESAVDALRKMTTEEKGRLPVVEGGRLKGILARNDIMSLYKVKSDLGK
ncbi:peptidase M50 [bacterium (candidate division B38) B3_B38]|nr:MAG: peptidase M50 [bacterium (candidate division B38) B3_B38]